MPATLKCSNCGGDLLFTPALQLWKCEWCDKEHTEQDLAGFPKGEQAGDPGVAAGRREETEQGVTVTYKCSYCGAEVTTTEETSQTFCVFCQRPVTILSQVSGAFKPDFLLPFRLVKENAIQQFKGFLKGKRFVPNSFSADKNIDKLTGVYIPFWLFDGTVHFNMAGEGDIVTHSRQGDYKITRTDTYRVVRGGQIRVSSVPVDASSKTPNNVMDSIEPFDFNDLKPFNTPYLSGFVAERFDETREQCFPRAERRMAGSADNMINASLSRYNSVRRQRDDKSTSGVMSRYALLPVWLLHSFFQEKDYIFAMNGQTGKMLGNLPIDKGKVFRFGLVVFLASGVGCALIGLLLRLLEVI